LRPSTAKRRSAACRIRSSAGTGSAMMLLRRAAQVRSPLRRRCAGRGLSGPTTRTELTFNTLYVCSIPGKGRMRAGTPGVPDRVVDMNELRARAQSPAGLEADLTPTPFAASLRWAVHALVYLLVMLVS